MNKNVNWDGIKEDFLSGKFTKKALSEKYDVSAWRINHRAQKEDWSLNDAAAKNKKGAKKSVKKSMKKKTSSKFLKVKKKQNIKIDYNEAHLKMYEDCARIIRALTKLYLDSNVEPDAGALQKLVVAIEKIQKGQRVSLGLDKDITDVTFPKINIVENLNKNKL